MNLLLKMSFRFLLSWTGNFSKVIALSAASNRLSNLQQQATSYASLIMDRLDPDHQGYIEVQS